MKARKAYVHVYTGNGKGKTTAAMGLVLRAVGAKMNVCFIQFMKGGDYSEHKILKKMIGVTLRHFGRKCFVGRQPAQEDVRQAARALEEVRRALTSGRYDMVVADEICVALGCGLIAQADILQLMQERPATVEFVLTGRGATPAICRQADLVTQMQEKKHYFKQGVPARRGIEF